MMKQMKIRQFFCFLLAVFMLLPLVSCSRFRSDDLSPGDPRHFKVDKTRFTLHYAPSAAFPSGIDDDIETNVTNPFWIGATEVTYELWHAVLIWAEENGYSFANKGQEGGQLGERGQEPSDMKDHPVTRVNWYDAAVWCNALSEYLELEPVYMLDGEIHRDGAARIMFDLELKSRVGFRLPTNAEWELAARYRGSDRSGDAIEYPKGSRMYWSPGNYASGAAGPVTDEEATMAAAWYKVNSTAEGARATHTRPVGQKPPRGNTLNLYDMSGNVFEWMHDHEYYTHRGGCYYHDAETQMIVFKSPDGAASRFSKYPNLGFRLVLPAGDGLIPEQTDSQTEEQESESEQVHTDDTEFETEDTDQTETDVTDDQFIRNTLVEVKYGTVWYPATILDIKDDEYFITYAGYDESWDEWVDSDRLRNIDQVLMLDSFEPLNVSVDPGTDLATVALPDRMNIKLENGIVIDAAVIWDLTGYNKDQEGEYVLQGQLIDVPVNIFNRLRFQAEMTISVRDPENVSSRLRLGEDTGVDGLLFYIDQEDNAIGYYFGIEADSELTHIVIENPDKSFAAMIVLDADLIPIQWVFPDLTISVLVDRGAFLDPAAARHSFLYDEEQETHVINIEPGETASEIMSALPLVFGELPADLRSDIAAALDERGWLELPVHSIIEQAENRHDLAFASMLSMISVYIKIMEAMDVQETEMSHDRQGSGVHDIVFLNQREGEPSKIVPVSLSNAVKWAIKEYLTGNVGPLIDMLSYLRRIHDKEYGGQDIEGPAVSMLLCKGASTVPNVCNEFYFPNTPGNASRCVSVCYVTMSCFTDICHPKMFSTEDALALRRHEKSSR